MAQVISPHASLYESRYFVAPANDYPPFSPSSYLRVGSHEIENLSYANPEMYQFNLLATSTLPYFERIYDPSSEAHLFQELPIQDLQEWQHAERIAAMAQRNAQDAFMVAEHTAIAAQRLIMLARAKASASKHKAQAVDGKSSTQPPSPSMSYRTTTNRANPGASG